MWPIFTKGADPAKNMKNTRGKTRGITRGNTRETLKPKRYGHTYARSSKHKEIHDPNPTRNDTKGSLFFSVRRS